MDAAGLLAQAIAAREIWHEVAPGKKVRIRRPINTALARLRGGVGLEELMANIVGWEGITEADVLGETVGSGDDAPFSPGLLAELFGEHPDWAGSSAVALVDAIVAHQAQRGDSAKN